MDPATYDKGRDIRSAVMGEGAVTNGVTRDEIREILLQVAIYAGVPAEVDGFRTAREAFTELDET